MTIKKSTGRTGQTDQTKPLQTKKKLTTEERRACMAEIISENGPWNVSKTGLAERFGVTRDTIYRDWAEVIKHVEPDDLKEAELHLGKVYRKAIDEMDTILSDPESKRGEKALAAKTMATVGKTLIEHYESFGRKETAVQRIEHSGEVRTKLFAIDASQYIKEVKK